MIPSAPAAAPAPSPGPAGRGGVGDQDGPVGERQPRRACRPPRTTCAAAGRRPLVGAGDQDALHRPRYLCYRIHHPLLLAARNVKHSKRATGRGSLSPLASTLALRRDSGRVAERGGRARHERARDFHAVGVRGRHATTKASEKVGSGLGHQTACRTRAPVGPGRGCAQSMTGEKRPKRAGVVRRITGAGSRRRGGGAPPRR